MTTDRHPIAFLAGLVGLVGLTVLTVACGSSSLGGGATDGTTCADLMNQYTVAYAQAQVCDPTAANQCQQPVQGPSCLGNCGALVQDPTAADAIVTKMINLGCAHPLACPCAAPQAYTCAPADGGGGICQGSFATPQEIN
jgi:hypothetical protein